MQARPKASNERLELFPPIKRANVSQLNILRTLKFSAEMGFKVKNFSLRHSGLQQGGPMGWGFAEVLPKVKKSKAIKMLIFFNETHIQLKVKIKTQYGVKIKTSYGGTYFLELPLSQTSNLTNVNPCSQYFCHYRGGRPIRHQETHICHYPTRENTIECHFKHLENILILEKDKNVNISHLDIS